MDLPLCVYHAAVMTYHQLAMKTINNNNLAQNLQSMLEGYNHLLGYASDNLDLNATNTVIDSHILVSSIQHYITVSL